MGFSSKPFSLGELVQVNGHGMNVFTAGGGGETLVLLAGSGTSSPILDFKPLWSRLIDEFQVVVVERAGYGFSDVKQGLSRDIDSILSETREALEKAGQKPPYVLVPHSMAGLEAIYWANNYPEEVTRIIGLDIAIPEVYEHMPISPLWALRIASFLASLGLVRFLPSVKNFPLFHAGYLSEADTRAYKELIYRKTLTTNMLAEVSMVRRNAKRVESQGVPRETPMYLFISTEQANVVADWQELATEYTERLKDGKYLVVDAGHYLHHYEPELLAEKIREYCNQLTSGAPNR